MMHEAKSFPSEFYFGTDPSTVSDSELVALLNRAYVGGGFTTPERAMTVFAPTGVRQRGQLIFARSQNDHALAGMVIVVLPDSAARRISESDETELHLLAVDPLYHGRGLGRALMTTALTSIQEQGFRKVVLWTQPPMTVAQRLYKSIGFVHNPGRDPTLDGTPFLAYEMRW
jgi:ribosomal protein S18 acetylase RimI-like enzyme